MVTTPRLKSALLVACMLQAPTLLGSGRLGYGIVNGIVGAAKWSYSSPLVQDLTLLAAAGSAAYTGIDGLAVGTSIVAGYNFLLKWQGANGSKTQLISDLNTLKTHLNGLLSDNDELNELNRFAMMTNQENLELLDKTLMHLKDASDSLEGVYNTVNFLISTHSEGYRSYKKILNNLKNHQASFKEANEISINSLLKEVENLEQKIKQTSSIRMTDFSLDVEAITERAYELAETGRAGIAQIGEDIQSLNEMRTMFVDLAKGLDALTDGFLDVESDLAKAAESVEKAESRCLELQAILDDTENLLIESRLKIVEAKTKLDAIEGRNSPLAKVKPYIYGSAAGTVAATAGFGVPTAIALGSVASYTVGETEIVLNLARNFSKVVNGESAYSLSKFLAVAVKDSSLTIQVKWGQSTNAVTNFLSGMCGLGRLFGCKNGGAPLSQRIGTVDIVQNSAGNSSGYEEVLASLPFDLRVDEQPFSTEDLYVFFQELESLEARGTLSAKESFALLFQILQLRVDYSRAAVAFLPRQIWAHRASAQLSANSHSAFLVKMKKSVERMRSEDFDYDAIDKLTHFVHRLEERALDTRAIPEIMGPSVSEELTDFGDDDEEFSILTIDNYNLFEQLGNF